MTNYDSGWKYDTVGEILCLHFMPIHWINISYTNY